MNIKYLHEFIRIDQHGQRLWTRMDVVVMMVVVEIMMVVVMMFVAGVVVHAVV